MRRVTGRSGEVDPVAVKVAALELAAIFAAQSVPVSKPKSDPFVTALARELLALLPARPLPRDAANDAREVIGPDCVINARARFLRLRRDVKKARAEAYVQGYRWIKRKWTERDRAELTAIFECMEEERASAEPGISDG